MIFFNKFNKYMILNLNLPSEEGKKRLCLQFLPFRIINHLPHTSIFSIKGLTIFQHFKMTNFKIKVFSSTKKFLLLLTIYILNSNSKKGEECIQRESERERERKRGGKREKNGIAAGKNC